MFVLRILPLLLLPNIVFGATTFKTLVAGWVELLQNVFGFIFILIFVYVMWVLLHTWVRRGQNEAAQVEGRVKLFAAIIGLVVLSALWGIVGYANLLITS